MKDSRPKRDEQKSEQVVSFNVNQIRDRKLLHETCTTEQRQENPQLAPQKNSERLETISNPKSHAGGVLSQ